MTKKKEIPITQFRKIHFLHISCNNCDLDQNIAKIKNISMIINKFYETNRVFFKDSTR